MMASWADFAVAAPDMAGVLLRRGDPAPIMFLATVRQTWRAPDREGP